MYSRLELLKVDSEFEVDLINVFGVLNEYLLKIGFFGSTFIFCLLLHGVTCYYLEDLQSDIFGDIFIHLHRYILFLATHHVQKLTFKSE